MGGKRGHHRVEADGKKVEKEATTIELMKRASFCHETRPTLTGQPLNWNVTNLEVGVAPEWAQIDQSSCARLSFKSAQVSHVRCAIVRVKSRVVAGCLRTKISSKLVLETSAACV